VTKTNTSNSRQRRDADYYPTPKWCVDRILDRKPIVYGNTILEPSAGDGSLVKAFGEFDFLWTLVECREECRKQLEGLGEVHIADFLSWELSQARFDTCVMNPPYKQAEDFIRKAMSCCNEIYALLRVGFVSATLRHGWLRRNMPDVYLLPNRPSFIGTGERDANEYAWFYWDTTRPLPRYSGEVTLLDVTHPDARRP
jgi:hypothetical protein